MKLENWMMNFRLLVNECSLIQGRGYWVHFSAVRRLLVCWLARCNREPFLVVCLLVWLGSLVRLFAEQWQTESPDTLGPGG